MNYSNEDDLEIWNVSRVLMIKKINYCYLCFLACLLLLLIISFFFKFDSYENLYKKKNTIRIFFIYLKKGNKYFCLKNYYRNWDLKEKKKFFLIEWWLIRMRYFFFISHSSVLEHFKMVWSHSKLSVNCKGKLIYFMGTIKLFPNWLLIIMITRIIKCK